MLASESMTERKQITCPETGQLESVELDHTPLGLLVTGCSRYPDGAIACPGECARRLDRRERAAIEDRERVLVIVANPRDDAASIAAMLAAYLAEDELAVELAVLEGNAPPPLEDYDAVVIGGQIRFGRHTRAAVEYIRGHRCALAALPAFFYSVGGHGVFDRDSYLRRMIRRTGWQPMLAATFADASPVQRGDIRAFARQIAEAVPPALRPAMS